MAKIPRRNEKQKLCKIGGVGGGQIRCIMGNVEVAYTPQKMTVGILSVLLQTKIRTFKLKYFSVKSFFQSI